MLVNLTEYFKSATGTSSLTVGLEDKVLSVNGLEYEVIPTKDLDINFKKTQDDKLEISGSGTYNIKMFCDRCLLEVIKEVSVCFEYKVSSTDSGFSDEETEDFISGYELDTERLIHSELIMGLPMKVLCKDDCKGICPVCGSNRNKGECGCDTFVPDPRMAAIQDIFNAINKEV